MNLQKVAYWGAFAIPLILLGTGIVIQRIVDGGKQFKAVHFYLGLDLTVYYLAAVLVNVLDIADATPVKAVAIAWTLFLVVAGIVMLVVQIGLHQAWLPDERKGRTQFAMLGVFSNAIGILLLYGFVKLKAGGLV